MSTPHPIASYRWRKTCIGFQKLCGGREMILIGNMEGESMEAPHPPLVSLHFGPISFRPCFSKKITGNQTLKICVTHNVFGSNEHNSWVEECVWFWATTTLHICTCRVVKFSLTTWQEDADDHAFLVRENSAFGSLSFQSGLCVPKGTQWNALKVGTNEDMFTEIQLYWNVWIKQWALAHRSLCNNTFASL